MLGRPEPIGLVLPDIANPFFASFVAAVEQEADLRGLGVSLFATLNRPGREVSYLQLIERNHVNGLIFLTNHPDDGQLSALINRAPRVVVADEHVPGARAPKLFCDNGMGGRLVGQHLGARALTLLTDMIWPEPRSFAEDLLPVELVARESVAPPAGPR